MLIRSADKSVIINLETASVVEVGECTDAGECAVYVRNRCAGVYKSEQRAIEVLDEICKAYLNLNVDAINYGCDNGGYVKNGIYQMPPD